MEPNDVELYWKHPTNTKDEDCDHRASGRVTRSEYFRTGDIVRVKPRKKSKMTAVGGLDCCWLSTLLSSEVKWICAEGFGIKTSLGALAWMTKSKNKLNILKGFLRVSAAVTIPSGHFPSAMPVALLRASARIPSGKANQ